jgi:hypothetical protein
VGFDFDSKGLFGRLKIASLHGGHRGLDGCILLCAGACRRVEQQDGSEYSDRVVLYFCQQPLPYGRGSDRSGARQQAALD